MLPLNKIDLMARGYHSKTWVLETDLDQSFPKRALQNIGSQKLSSAPFKQNRTKKKTHTVVTYIWKIKINQVFQMLSYPQPLIC